MSSHIILASGSPRRRELFSQFQLPFEIIVSDIDETPHMDELASAMVSRLACEKATAIAERFPDRLCIGADTTVVLPVEPPDRSKELILGKPADRNDATRMLSLLQGRTHAVYTGIALVWSARACRVVETVRSEVTIMPLSTQDIAAYVDTGEPDDKAGAYAVQGRGSVFIERINGSYSSVVGLPLAELSRHLRSLGLWPPHHGDPFKLRSR